MKQGRKLAGVLGGRREGRRKQAPPVDLNTRGTTDGLGKGVHVFAEGINGSANDFFSWLD